MAGLLRYHENFVKRQKDLLKSLSPGLQAKKEVKAMMAGLPKIKKIINPPANYVYNQKDAKELISIGEPLRKTLLSD